MKGEPVSRENQRRTGRPCAVSVLTPAAASQLWDETSPQWDDEELGRLVHGHPCTKEHWTHTFAHRQTLEDVRSKRVH
ncbi:hypothetical protein JOQ06_023679 [Pogonophryne albipinna]|uniref:Uncharacterized protein n=1 Tax=Pogonophryne albipinna TaxID=1090488 RepID=A0AAD6BLP2_9TELE|nr:hypothetical protein JOQ06_023679 [Pogonophryne albipinna]